jgi:hypothetical protein
MCPRRAGASVRGARVRTTNSPENHREEVTVKVETADRTARRRIATTDSDAEAEAVEHVSIVGRDLEFVEQMTGHVNAWKAALSGAASGLLFGLLFGGWFAHDGTSLVAILAYWAGFGALIGAVIALVGHALSGGRRDSGSITGTQAHRFDILVDEAFADEAVRRLGAGRIHTP